MLGTGVQSATLNSMASVGLNEKVTFQERLEERKSVGEKARRASAKALRQDCGWHVWGTGEKPACGIS